MFSHVVLIALAIVALCCWIVGDAIPIPKLSEVGKYVFLICFVRLVWVG